MSVSTAAVAAFVEAKWAAPGGIMQTLEEYIRIPNQVRWRRCNGTQEFMQRAPAPSSPSSCLTEPDV